MLITFHKLDSFNIMVYFLIEFKCHYEGRLHYLFMAFFLVLKYRIIYSNHSPTPHFYIFQEVCFSKWNESQVVEKGTSCWTCTRSFKGSLVNLHSSSGETFPPFRNEEKRSLAGVAQWIECQPLNQMGASSIPSVGHMPELLARSPVGGTGEATTQWCFSPSLSPTLPLSLKINKIWRRRRNEKWALKKECHFSEPQSTGKCWRWNCNQIPGVQKWCHYYMFTSCNRHTSTKSEMT